MTAKEFLRAISNGKEDLIQIFLDILSATNTDYAVIGGLGVNAYAEPVVSLDLDIVVVAENIERICQKTETQGFKIERFPHSINLDISSSELRIQLKTDKRYQDFLASAEKKYVLGYEMNVARKEDVLQGKLWAYQDQTRRKSKRQKDLADIIRLVEAYPQLITIIPEQLKKEVE
jgi:hypothetical protein